MFGFADGAEDAGAPVEAAVVAIVIGAMTSTGIAKRVAGPGNRAVRAMQCKRFVGRDERVSVAMA